eukprot:TRINITY_DN4533_c3_g1_i1.p1 TRINITY_DN4533_c3_g1~~TRINITY_DN4533_c3_g1_i1.p1  ORF type:complete len:131 (-),score=19.52 TRINITY_DN4533_c3_g1_i1:170-562(-)
MLGVLGNRVSAHQGDDRVAESPHAAGGMKEVAAVRPGFGCFGSRGGRSSPEPATPGVVNRGGGVDFGDQEYPGIPASSYPTTTSTKALSTEDVTEGSSNDLSNGNVCNSASTQSDSQEGRVKAGRRHVVA